MSEPRNLQNYEGLNKTLTVEEDSLQFLWAVSYCDLLMVLMSFFIMFFSLEDSSDPSALKNILLTLKDSVHQEVVAAPTNASAEKSNKLEVISTLFFNNEIKTTRDPNNNNITIDFDPNLYGPGAYAFPEQHRDKLTQVLDLVKTHMRDIQITFIGHSDEAPIFNKKTKIINSNLVLSSLRAARAVEYAIQSGFDPKYITGMGADQHSRNTRSLSIKISERSKAP